MRSVQSEFSDVNIIKDYDNENFWECCCSCKREKASTNRLHSPVEVKTPTMIRAEEIKSSLGSEFPSFAKLLVRSHVSSCFWMVTMTCIFEIELSIESIVQANPESFPVPNSFVDRGFL